VLVNSPVVCVVLVDRSISLLFPSSIVAMALLLPLLSQLRKCSFSGFFLSISLAFALGLTYSMGSSRLDRALGLLLSSSRLFFLRIDGYPDFATFATHNVALVCTSLVGGIQFSCRLPPVYSIKALSC
jgi:hypothetical protein